MYTICGTQYVENKCTQICRFCLETVDSNFETIEDATLANLDFLWLKLNLSISEEPLMCGDCAKIIGNCSDFKTKCLEMENYMVSSVIDKDSIKIDLREVYVRKMSVEGTVDVPEDNMVCRLCLELVKNDSSILLNDSADIVPKLEQYFPELDLACTEDPAICAPCQVSLQRYFSFVNTCLTSEEKITEYCKIEGTNGKGQIDLNSVIHFISKDFVKCKFEIDTLKIEEMSYDDSDNASNDVEIKKEEILDMECYIKEDNLAQEPELTDADSFQHHLSPSQSDCVPQLTRAKPKHTCEICGYQNNRRGRLQEHILAHKGIVQEFNCEMCPFKTKSKDYLRKHMFRHKDASEVTMYKCDLCAYETKHKAYMRQHMPVHKDKSEIEMYKCKLCSYETKWRASLRRHLLAHENIPPTVAKPGTWYQCDLCDHKTKQNSDLKRHMLTHKTHSEVTVYKCDQCAYETKYKQYLRQHTLVHKDKSETTIYKCELCDYETKWKDYLKRHKLRHKTYSELSMLSCSHCGYETIYKESLTKHMVRHMDVSKIKMYKCYMCPFESKWNHSLQRHQICHGTTSPAVGKPGTIYKCDKCDFETKWKKSLQRHVLTHQAHSEITMYKCYHCEYESKRKGGLSRHMLAHQSPEKITMFKCDHCAYETRHKNCLRQHTLVHKDKSEIEMLKCKLCSYETKWRASLRNHVLAHESTPQL